AWRGGPLLLPAARLAGGLWWREAHAPPAPGGEARGEAAATGGARPACSRRRASRAGCCGERRVQRGGPLLLPAAKLVGRLRRREARGAGQAPPSPGGEAHGRAAAARGARGGAGPSF